MYESKLFAKREFEQELDKRWGWITSDIEEEEEKLNTQLVLENSYKKMVNEGSLPM